MYVSGGPADQRRYLRRDRRLTNRRRVPLEGWRGQHLGLVLGENAARQGHVTGLSGADGAATIGKLANQLIDSAAHALHGLKPVSLAGSRIYSINASPARIRGVVFFNP
jgi:hypothetical protein